MEKVLELYKYIDGVNDAKFPNDEEQVVVRDFRYDAKRMGGAPTISFSIKHSLCLDNLWDNHVYAMFNGERYYVKQTPTSSYSNEDTRYKHEVELISERTILDNVYFYDVVTIDVENDKPVSNSSKFSFFGDIHEYVKRVGYSLSWSGLDYTIEIDENIVSEEKQVSFENQVITSVLQEIYNIYQIPYYFDGKVIHVGYYQSNIDHVFKYGAQNSLLSISKTNANAKIVNRITGVGSQDNIPYYYPNDDEKGITRPLLNDSTSGVQIVSSSKYRKIRLSDRFIFNQTIQAKTSLIDENNYTLGDLRIGSFKDEKSKFIVDFLYSFTLKQGENVEFSVTSSYDDNVGLSYDMYKKGGNYIGPFVDSSQMYLSSGEYSFVVRWSFMAQGTMVEIEEKLQSLIATYLNIRAHIDIDADNTWTLNGIPVSLEHYGLQVDNPNDGDVVSIEQISYINPQSSLMPPIYRETLGQERFYNALNDTYVDEESGDMYSFSNEYSSNQPKEHIEDFEDIKPTIKNVTNNDGYRIDRFLDFAYDLYDNDEVDENGKYIHPYFFAKLHRFDGEWGFNLFDHAIDESEMIISMTSGSCGSCSFKVLVNKETQKNTVQVDEYGNLLRDNNGNVRFGSPQDRQNDTENYEVWIALEKDIQTFGVIMPNATNNYRPSAGDTFVILHIDLPKSYIEAAEKKLENELIKYMYENNFEKFNFSISFSRIFFAEQPNILANLTENSRLNVEYNGNIYELYVSSLSYAMNSSQPLPEIKVELDDVIAISQNQISQIVASTKKEILAVSNQDVFWKDIKGVPSWITNEKPQYSYNELYGRSAQEDNGIWVVKTDGNGNKYIFSIYPVVTQYGITMYADGGELDLPSIYAGLLIDGRTLIRDDNGVLMINPDIELGGGLTEVYWNDIKAKPTFATVATSGKYSDLSGLPDLSVYATTEYLTAELKKYVTLNTEQTIAAHKNFLNGLSVGGLGITKSQDDVIYLDANLVVRGGITMYSDNTVDVGSIYDGLPIDGTTIYWENDKLKANITEGVITNITSDMVVEALGYTPYSASNPKGYISGITSDMVVSALGYTPLQNHQTIYDLTIQKNGTTVGTYTPNSAKKTINIVVPTKVSELDNDNDYATTSELDSRIDTLINGAPAAYDTLKEIADVLQGNVNSIGDIITTLGTKADKAIKISAGTGLSGGGTLEADRTLSLATSGVTAGTYKSVTVDKYGRVTSGTNPTTLAGYGITDAYTKAKVDELLSLYVTLAGTQTITGEKDFTGGLKVNGSPIVYDATNKYWKLEGDLLVTGGVTMFASDSAFTPSTIMNAIDTDGTNLKVVNGVLTFVGSIDGGEAGSVAWENVEGKPSWIGASKPSYAWSEITGKPSLASVATSGKYADLSGVPTLLSSFTNDVGFITSYVDTKNTAGSTNTSSKIFLIGATSQAANPQTYSHDTAYVGTDGYLYSGGAKVLTSHQTIYNLTMQAGAFSAVTFDPNGANKTVNIPTTTSHITEGDNLYYTNARAQAAITGGASTIVTSNLTANRALISNASGKVAVSAVTSTELGYLDGVTSAIQTQLDSKLAATSYTAADVIAKLLTVDGASSGLDADLLDGTHKSGLLTAASSSSATNLSITVGGTTKTITDLYAYKTTQLETARTIWGQSFDGSANVTGDLTVGDGNLILNNNKELQWKNMNGENVSIITYSNNNALSIGTGVAQAGKPLYIKGYNVYLQYGTNHTPGLYLKNTGNVLIGTTTDSGYKLDVVENIADKIFKVSGANNTFRVTSSGIGAYNNVNGGWAMYSGSASNTSARFEILDNTGAWIKSGWTLFKNGNINIGAYSDNGYKLNVAGTIHTDSSLHVDSYGNFKGNLFLNSLAQGIALTGSGVSWHNAENSITNNLVEYSSDGSVNIVSTLKISNIPLYKSQDDVLYIDGNLAVRGGITMYATDAIDVDDVIKNLPIAGSSAKGIAAFNPNDFSVVDGYVSFIGNTGVDESVLADYAKKTDLSAYLPISGGQMTGNIGYTLSLDSYEIGLPAAGSFECLAGINKVSSYKSFIGSIYTGDWYHVLSIRHRNGKDDGNKFGLLLYTTFATGGSLEWNRQYNGSWTNSRVILDSVNWSQYISAGQIGAYLPLSGGTLTGRLNVYNTLNAGQNINGTATIDAFNGMAYYGCDAVSNGQITSSTGAFIAIKGTTGFVAMGHNNPLYKLDVAASTNQIVRVISVGTAEASIRYTNNSNKTWVAGIGCASIGDGFGIYSNTYGKNALYCDNTGMTVIAQTTSIGNKGIAFNRNIHQGGIFDTSTIGVQMNIEDGGLLVNHFNTLDKGTRVALFARDGFLSYGGITMYSDIRKKTKLKDVELSLKQIADAPLIEHYYNSDAMRTTHVGSIAQYWAGINDWFCKLDNEGFYTMEIQNAALASAISIARELVKYESKTDKEIRLLKDEVKRLKKEIKILKSA